jgi:hypothetical protein
MRCLAEAVLDAVTGECMCSVSFLCRLKDFVIVCDKGKAKDGGEHFWLAGS